MKEYYLFTFASTHYAIRAQKLLSGLKFVTMPTLRELSASCGISIRILPEQLEEATARMGEEAGGWQLYYISQNSRETHWKLLKK